MGQDSEALGLFCRRSTIRNRIPERQEYFDSSEPPAQKTSRKDGFCKPNIEEPAVRKKYGRRPKRRSISRRKRDGSRVEVGVSSKGFRNSRGMAWAPALSSVAPHDSNSSAALAK